MFDRKDDLHMANTRKDSKGRGLHVGEQQRKDGVYLYLVQVLLLVRAGIHLLTGEEMQ